MLVADRENMRKSKHTYLGRGACCKNTRAATSALTRELTLHSLSNGVSIPFFSYFFFTFLSYKNIIY